MPDANAAGAKAANAAKGIASGELVLCDKEIDLLYRIQAMEDEEFETKKEEMTREWRATRDGLYPPKAKVEKGDKAKGKGKGKGKGKKGKKGSEEDEDGCDSCEDGEE